MKHLSLSILSLALVATLTFAADPKIARDLEKADPASTADVIIQFKDAPTDAQHKKVAERGGIHKSTLNSAKAGVYTIPVSALKDLANDPEVVYISPDRKLHGMLDNTTNAVNAATAWNAGYTGSGIGVAVIDSGVTLDSDLTNTLVNQSYVTNDAHDYYGHGTHVAGIIAGTGAHSHCYQCTRNLQGLAPGAKIINLRVLDQNGEGSDSNVIAAIDEAISLKATYNIRVINLSLGRPVYESYAQDPLCHAVEEAWKAGIVVVAAAGNNGRSNPSGNYGYGTIMAPGNDPYVITVGATNTVETYTRTDDKMTSYSSKGPTAIDHIVKPDLVAPGNHVVSLYDQSGSLYNSYPGNMVANDYLMNNGDTSPSGLYFTLSGTSMATPVVSGAVALLLQAHPTLTPDQVKAKLMLTAWKGLPKVSIATDPVTGITYAMQSDAFTVGAGYLDIAAALADTTSFSGTANSPVATYNSSSGVTALVCSSSSVCAASVTSTKTVWGAASIWGSASVFGSSSVNANKTVWGAKTIWGATSVLGDSVTASEASESVSTTINGEN